MNEKAEVNAWAFFVIKNGFIDLLGYQSNKWESLIDWDFVEMKYSTSR